LSDLNYSTFKIEELKNKIFKFENEIKQNLTIKDDLNKKDIEVIRLNDQIIELEEKVKQNMTN
jgi:hypothetical protein